MVTVGEAAALASEVTVTVLAEGRVWFSWGDGTTVRGCRSKW